jgi:hypothetical protein
MRLPLPFHHVQLPSASLEVPSAEGDTQTAAEAVDVPAVMAPCASVGEPVSTKSGATQQNGKARSKSKAAPAKKNGE